MFPPSPHADFFYEHLTAALELPLHYVLEVLGVAVLGFGGGDRGGDAAVVPL